MAMPCCVYDELRALAAQSLRDAGLHTLCTTELVGEAHRRFATRDPSARMDQIRFKTIAAHAIRQLLVREARERRLLGPPLRAHWMTLDLKLEEVIALDGALRALASFDRRCAHTVELSCFGGMTSSEIAIVLDASLVAVQQDLELAEASVHRVLRNEVR
jgi:hypothetical protein